MKYPATVVAAALAAFLFGLSFASKPVPAVDNSATITSLEFEVKNLQEEVLLKANEIAELKARKPEVVTETIRVRDDAEIARLTAELQKARQRPEALPKACAEVPRYETAVPSAVPQRVEYYQPRRRLFGRFR